MGTWDPDEGTPMSSFSVMAFVFCYLLQLQEKKKLAVFSRKYPNLFSSRTSFSLNKELLDTAYLTIGCVQKLEWETRPQTELFQRIDKYEIYAS